MARWLGASLRAGHLWPLFITLSNIVHTHFPLICVIFYLVFLPSATLERIAMNKSAAAVGVIAAWWNVRAEAQWLTRWTPVTAALRYKAVIPTISLHCTLAPLPSDKLIKLKFINVISRVSSVDYLVDQVLDDYATLPVSEIPTHSCFFSTRPPKRWYSRWRKKNNIKEEALIDTVHFIGIY